MSISSNHMRASYDTYIRHGNSSSATVFSVMDRLRQKDMDECAPEGKVKDFVVGCAFGPGISIEMCIMKRNLNHVRRELVVTGDITPPLSETDPSVGEVSRSDTPVELEKEVESVSKSGAELENRMETVQPQIPEQNDSLADALNGVELD